MNVWIVFVGSHVNSVWRDKARAEAHEARLREVNGDQIASHVVEIEVRE